MWGSWEGKGARPWSGTSTWRGPGETDKAVEMGPGYDTIPQWGESAQGPRRSGFFCDWRSVRETDLSEFRMPSPL